MDEEAEIGYLYPTSNVEQANLEIKVLTKKCVFLQCSNIVPHRISYINFVVFHTNVLNHKFSLVQADVEQGDFH